MQFAPAKFAQYVTLIGAPTVARARVSEEHTYYYYWIGQTRRGLLFYFLF
jgi:hypothetical protein